MREYENSGLKKQKRRLTRPLRIISDASIATAYIGEGRNIPLVIIDANERVDIEEYIINHQKYFAGDVDSTWGFDHNKFIILIIEVKTPTECQIVLEFDVAKQGLLIDMIMHAKALYVQTGKDGDRMINTPESPKVLFEIPADIDVITKWNEIYFYSIVKKLKKKGLSKKQAIDGAKEMMKQFEIVKDLKMPS